MSHINKNNCVILNKLKVNIEKSLNLKLYDKKKKNSFSLFRNYYSTNPF